MACAFVILVSLFAICVALASTAPTDSTEQMTITQNEYNNLAQAIAMMIAQHTEEPLSPAKLLGYIRRWKEEQANPSASDPTAFSEFASGLGLGTGQRRKAWARGPVTLRKFGKR